jgi:transcriptional regulator with XRE-family HTH domain
LNNITPRPRNADFQRLQGLAKKIADRGFRASYMSHSLRAFLADQIRALRGDLSQKAFGEPIGKPQSVVSRLENEDYGKVTLQTLIDIAEKLDIALLVRFTDFPTFIRSTADISESAFAPRPFAKVNFDEMLREEATAAGSRTVRPSR